MFAEIPDPLDWLGFTFNGDILCRTCVHVTAEDESKSDDPGAYSLAELLEQWAAVADVDVTTLESFCSMSEFPKPFDYAEETEECHGCGRNIHEDYDIHVRTEGGFA